MEAAEVRAKTATGPIFHELAERFRKRGVVFILSDLFDDVASMMAGLKHFRHRRHDVILFHVLDAAEVEFPFRSPTLFKGLEQMPDVVADPRSLRKAYLQRTGRLPARTAARLPQPGHGLPAGPHRPAVGRGAVRVPGSADGASQVMRRIATWNRRRRTSNR